MVGIDLRGRVALVTGGSRGLGRAAALSLAEAGADVAVSYVRNRKAALAVVTACREHGVRALAVRADMVVSSQAQALVRRVAAELGRLDVMVCNAGIWQEAAVDTMSDKELARMLDVNVKGVFACVRAAVPVMKRQRSGRIILVSSTAGRRGEAFHSHYAASKGAIISLTKSLGPELAPYGILANCIAPGWFDTDMSRPTLSRPAAMREVRNAIPLRRVGRPEEFAGAVLFLASELSTFVTGEILNVNGGAVLAG